MDLGRPVLIYAVGTQGSHLSDNWVLKYMVRYSDDGRSWKFYSQVNINSFFLLKYFHSFSSSWIHTCLYKRLVCEGIILLMGQIQVVKAEDIQCNPLVPEIPIFLA